MELSLVSKRGVPEDAIISIRSGAVRRQGGVSADKPFRFPPSTSDVDCVVKVDLMQNIGSGYLVMRPNQTESKQYEVVLNQDQDMACEIAVQPAGGSAPAVSSTQEETAAAAKTKQDAKAYLESTGLLSFVQGVLQVVAKQQPHDPFAAMAKHFLSASDEAVAPKVGSPKAAPAIPKLVAAVEEEAVPSGTPAAAAVENASAKVEDEVNEPKSAPLPMAENEANAAPPAAAEEAKPSDEKAAAASSPTKEEEENTAPPTAAEEAKASDAPPPKEEDAASEHVDENKSDTLEEFTSKVADSAQAVETLAAAAAVAAGVPAGVAAATLAAEQAEAAPVVMEAAPAG